MFMTNNFTYNGGLLPQGAWELRFGGLIADRLVLDRIRFYRWIESYHHR